MKPLNLEKVVDYLVECGKGRTDKEMAAAWAEEAINVGEWMRDYLGGDITESLQTGYHPTYDGVEEISSWAPTVGAGTWQIEGEGLFKILSDAVEDRGIQVLTETSAKELLTNLDGEVVGLLAEAGGSQLAIKAKRAVILTCGGFEHNDWMKQHYLKTYPVYGFSNTGNTGDAITMAGKLGARIWKISELAGFLAHKFPGEDRTWLSMLQFVIGGYSAIIVNRHGERFTNETLSYDTFHKELNRYDPVTDEYPNVPAYCIIDEATKTTLPMGYGPGWSTDNNAEIEKGWIIKADTIGELATKIGMDPETLEATVDKYNEYCAAGEDPDYGRTALIPIGDGPYYAMEGYPGTTSTWGGPKINTKAQIVDTYEQVIPRLYAAGVASCGVLGFWYFGNGGNLGDAFAFGRIAGRAAAAETSWE